jgi:hypothetical protein
MKYLIALLAAVITTPAMANTVCTFTTECLEGEVCNDTSMQVTLAPDAGADGRWTMTSDAETLQGEGFQSEGPSHLVFLSETTGHFLSIDGDFNARYSIHMEGPFSITYHGTCEAGS